MTTHDANPGDSAAPTAAEFEQIRQRLIDCERQKRWYERLFDRMQEFMHGKGKFRRGGLGPDSKFTVDDQ